MKASYYITILIRCGAREAQCLHNNRPEAIISRLRCFWMFLKQAFLSLIDFISEWTSVNFLRFIRTFLDPASQTETV